mmetsp:Transcript_48004/g.112052  ORF Transcript_48004/g.112052 Transcript_48004/m.112052 type:complete len:258 (+) Transcript_48004:72-845(+)
MFRRRRGDIEGEEQLLQGHDSGTITLRKASGEKISVGRRKNDLIADVKRRIQEVHNIPEAQQILQLESTYLQDDFSLSRFGLPKRGDVELSLEVVAEPLYIEAELLVGDKWGEVEQPEILMGYLSEDDWQALLNNLDEFGRTGISNTRNMIIICIMGVGFLALCFGLALIDNMSKLAPEFFGFFAGFIYLMRCASKTKRDRTLRGASEQAVLMEGRIIFLLDRPHKDHFWFKLATEVIMRYYPAHPKPTPKEDTESA